MTIKEVRALIAAYPVKSTLDQSVKDLLETVADRAYEAGQADGAMVMTEVMGKVMGEYGL